MNLSVESLIILLIVGGLVGVIAQQMIDQGRQILRFGTFGDEALWATLSSCIRPFRVRSSEASVRA